MTFAENRYIRNIIILDSMETRTSTMLRTPDEKIVVFHGTQQENFTISKNDPEEFFNLWNDPSAEKRKNELLARCFDASVFTMDPHPPRLGPF